ncbi:unnamed protein product [Strongylus vulgaris]|uniref:Reverse transcriptase domain-containing protein n=1 Tax=Strongylus vulgaris TaxID=40348 RepID=A0A3P7I3T4_STRVU|nr:unnamed protein product [Strongylus vulgaris]
MSYCGHCEAHTPEIYIDEIDPSRSHAPCIKCGKDKPFLIRTGIHQGSLFTLLFITVMDAVTGGLKQQPPLAFLYGGEAELMLENSKEFEEEVQR